MRPCWPPRTTTEADPHGSREEPARSRVPDASLGVRRPVGQCSPHGPPERSSGARRARSAAPPRGRARRSGTRERRRPESNWCARLCRPLPNHSATAPEKRNGIQAPAVPEARDCSAEPATGDLCAARSAAAVGEKLREASARALLPGLVRLQRRGAAPEVSVRGVADSRARPSGEARRPRESSGTAFVPDACLADWRRDLGAIPGEMRVLQDLLLLHDAKDRGDNRRQECETKDHSSRIGSHDPRQ